MKTKLVMFGLGLTGVMSAQTWGGSTGVSGDAYRTGNVGIGVSAPTQKLDVRGGAVHVVNNGYTFIGRNTTPGSDWYFYHRITTNYHILGSSKNASGSFKNLGFAIGANDDEQDVKMTIVPNGNVGIGTSNPGYKLHVESDDANMTSNLISSSSPLFEPTYQGTYSKLECTNKFGVHAGVYGHDLNNKSASGGYAITGIGVFGKAERSEASTSNVLNIGVYGKATSVPAVYNIGGLFYGNTWDEIGSKNSNENISEPTLFGVWTSTSGKNGIAGYFNGTSYSTSMYYSADKRLKGDIKPVTLAIDKLKILEPISFNFKTDEFKNLNLSDGEQMGLDPENLEKVFPNLVKEMIDFSGGIEKEEISNDLKKYKTINYTSLIPLLIAGVQEQQKQIEDQAKVNEELKNLVAMQQQQIEDLLAKSSLATGISMASGEDNFSLEQNIPNPFSNETVIKYNLPETIGKAKMVVYDLSGKQIASFPLDQKGSSSLTLSSDKLAAGIYIYSIIVDGKVMDSKRMVVAEKE